MLGTAGHLLLHEEAVDGLLAAHELHDLAVEVDEERAPEATGNPGQSQGKRCPAATTSTTSAATATPGAIGWVLGWPHSPDDGKGRQLLQVEGEVEAEAGFEQCRDCLWGMVGVSRAGQATPVPSPCLRYLHPCSRRQGHGR